MKNPAVDAYNAKSADFARPILKRLRVLMHKACPKVEETVKWGVPHFEYKVVIAGMAALKKNARARAAFAGFTPSQQREYVEWLIDAKQVATRARRLATAIEWMAEGKTRNWKYQNC